MTDMYIAFRETTAEEPKTTSEFVGEQIRIDRDESGKIIGVELLKPWCFFVQQSRHDLIRNQNIVTQEELDTLVAIAKEFFGNAELVPHDEEFGEFYLYEVRVVVKNESNIESWEFARQTVEKQSDFHSKVIEVLPDLHCNVFVMDIVHR